jgi:hypothetical protein
MVELLAIPLAVKLNVLQGQMICRHKNGSTAVVGGLLISGRGT